MNFEEKVEASIAALQPEMVTFLTRLVQFPSLPGEEQAAQHFVAGKLKNLEADVAILSSDYDELKDHPAFSDDGVAFVDRLNVVGTWAGSGKGRSLILNGHMDVVPVGNPSLWTYPPWSGLVRDGKLHGRGACDMKAGLTAAVFAVEALRHAGFRPAGDVRFESVIGEESGGVGTLTTIVRNYSADAAIIMEPTRLRICPVHAGALSFRIRVSGRAIHASMKRFGVSAIDKFQRIFAALEQLDQQRHAQYQNALFEFSNNIAPILVGTIAAGDWPSTVPEALIAEGRFGVFPGETPAEARAALQSCLAQAIEGDEWLQAHPPALEWFEGQFEPGETKLEEPILECLADAHRSVLGQSPRVQGVPYGSDLRLFTLYGKTPCALYGPGDVAFAHTVEEHVELREVFDCARVLAKLITDWCG